MNYSLWFGLMSKLLNIMSAIYHNTDIINTILLYGIDLDSILSPCLMPVSQKSSITARYCMSGTVHALNQSIMPPSTFI